MIIVAGSVICNYGDAFLLRAALRGAREHGLHGRERLTPNQIDRLELIIARFETCEDEHFDYSLKRVG